MDVATQRPRNGHATATPRPQHGALKTPATEMSPLFTRIHSFASHRKTSQSQRIAIATHRTATEQNPISRFASGHTCQLRYVCIYTVVSAFLTDMLCSFYLGLCCLLVCVVLHCSLCFFLCIQRCVFVAATNLLSSHKLIVMTWYLYGYPCDKSSC